MIADDSTDCNKNVADMPVSRNGAQVVIDVSTEASDTPKSPQHRAIIAGMAAWELWEDLSNAERLGVIFDHYRMPTQWFDESALPVLVAVWRDPVLRGRIKAKFKEIGGSPWDLANAVEDLLPDEPGMQSGATPDQGAVSSAAERPRFTTITAAELFAMNLAPLKWIVQDVLPAGATLFVGKGKDGKSLMAWNLCMAVVSGGVALGRYPVQQGDVLYLALEDGKRRAQKRLFDQMALAKMNKPPEGLEIVPWEAPRVREGFEPALEAWLDAHPLASLVVVDILEKIRPRRTHNGSVYADDYEAIAPLQRIVQERNAALLIVHHSNKSRPDDFRDTASGSMGLIGACDTFWGLRRLGGEANAELKIIGRDVEAQDLALRFEAGFWTVLGDAETVNLNVAHQAILDALTAAGYPLSPKQLAIDLGVNRNTMKSHLHRLEQKGLVLNLGNGHYIPRLMRESE